MKDLVSSHQRYGFALSKPYIQRAFGADSREEVEGIFEAVEKAFLEMVPSVPWMEEETKEIAIRKAKKMKKHLGYPDWVMVSQALPLSHFNLFSLAPLDSHQHCFSTLFFPT